MLHAQNARILGKVKDYHEQITLTQISDQSKLENAVDLKADGSFAIEVPVKAPTLAYLVFEDRRPAIQLFLEPGIKADLQISFREAIDDEGNKTTVADVDYTGDDKDCFEFLRQAIKSGRGAVCRKLPSACIVRRLRKCMRLSSETCIKRRASPSVV